MSTKRNDISKEHDVEMLWDMMSDFEKKWSLESVIAAAEVWVEKTKGNYLLELNERTK